MDFVSLLYKDFLQYDLQLYDLLLYHNILIFFDHKQLIKNDKEDIKFLNFSPNDVIQSLYYHKYKFLLFE